MTFIQDLAKLVVDGYSEQAMRHLMERSGDDAQKLYNNWGLVRRAIYRDESNRSPAYFDEMGQLMPTLRLAEDRAKMMTVTYGTLQLQHRLHSQKKPYLKDREANRLFKEIRPIVADFYEFILPEGSAEAYREEKEARRVEKQESGHGKISAQRAEAMLEVAIREINKVQTTLQNQWDLIASLLFVSGRRQYEMLVTMKTRPGDNDFQCRVSDLTKRKDSNSEEILIPLLCRYSKFHEKLVLVRSDPCFDWFTNLDQDDATRRMSVALIGANSRLFGHLPHTVRRNLYVELAWRRRLSENMFMPTASKGRFAQLILGHDSTRIGDTQIYQAFSLDDDEADYDVN